ncbi:MAG: hypothetical protein FWG64_06760 [Firmicutes bacterium]|nr:hypothetical protein [Bacillota bacterium]
MRIANNVPALLTHISLRQNDRHMTNSMNRLATGLRINTAREDAAGMSIANKLSFQLVGLNRSSDNSSHGVSLVQTAEGALNEVHAMLQRIRELAVQAANDTNVADDRIAIQREINSLTDEITAISRRTEFNTIGLLNGEASRVTTNWAVVGGNATLTRVISNAMFVTEGVPAGTLRYTISNLGAPAVVSGANAINWAATAPTSGRIGINGIDIDIPQGMSATDIWAQIVAASDAAGVVPTLPTANDPVQISSMRFGNHEEVRLTGDTDIWAMFGFGVGTARGQDVQIGGGSSIDSPAIASSNPNSPIDWNSVILTQQTVTINGVSITIPGYSTTVDVWNALNAAIGDPANNLNLTMSGAGADPFTISTVNSGSSETFNLGGSQAIWTMLGLSAGTYTGSDAALGAAPEMFDVAGNPITEFNNSLAVSIEGNRVTLTSRQGHSIQLSIFIPDDMLTGTPPQVTLPLDMELRIEEFGGLRVQIGPNFNMFMDIQIPRVSAETLGLTEIRAGEEVRLLHFTTQEGASRGINQVSRAIEMVSRTRSRLGAYQNRLEHTITNLDNSANNTEIARSRIQDTDMAREMTLMTQRQVLYQAGLSILGQANQRPQMILQLLQ